MEFYHSKKKTHTRIEKVNFYEGHELGYNVALSRTKITNLYGDNPRSWIRKCKKHFKLYFTLVGQWIEITAILRRKS